MSFSQIAGSDHQPATEAAICGLCGGAVTPYLPIAAKEAKNKNSNINIGRCQKCSSLWDLDSIRDDKCRSPEFQVGAHKAVYTLPDHIEALNNEINKRRALASSLFRLCNHDPKDILDFGCGNGLLAIALSEIAENVYACDLDLDAVLKAKEKCQATRILPISHISDLDDNSVDLVVAWHVIEHLSNPDSFFDQVVRVLRPGSTLIIQVPCLIPDYLIDAHVFFPTVESFDYIIRRWGFQDCHFSLDASNNFATYFLNTTHEIK